MARIHVMKDNITKEKYFYDTQADVSYRRIAGGMCWPSRSARPGCVVVLGEMRKSPMFYGAEKHDVYVLTEYCDVVSDRLIEQMRLLQSDYCVPRWSAPCTDDPRGTLLYDANLRQREHRQSERIRYGDPIGWRGGDKALQLMPFYRDLLAARTGDEKSLFFGSNSMCAQEIGGLDMEAMRRSPADYPCAAALFFALSDIDMLRYKEDRISMNVPADEIGGY